MTAAEDSARLYALNFDPELTPQQVFEAHRAFGLKYGGLPWHPVRPRRPGRLRVGFVSPDFRVHSVAYVFEPVLAGFDRKVVETFCYHDSPHPDDLVTRRLEVTAENWRDVRGWADQRLADQIHADGIDVLVDLAGHTPGNRLAMMARRCAPLQASAWGYPGSTGLQTMDLRVTDAVADPAGAEDHHTEKLLRIEGGFLAYRPALPDGPPLAAPPCLANGYVTFGSFNDLRKVSGAVLDAWADVLRRVPGSRLLLKAFDLRHDHVRAELLAQLGDRGVGFERVELRPWWRSHLQHLQEYRRVDVALDPFPYGGTVTTLEALWMGVPVVTLAGDRHASRVGASILSRAGLGFTAASNVEDYVRTAVNWAQDLRLALRTDPKVGLRAKMQFAPLGDGARVARQLEAASARHLSRRG